MRILITNDDGVYAEGLHALRAELERKPDLELLVIAPDRERSASSHAITLHKPLHVNRVEFHDAIAPVYSVNGTPADCTKIGSFALLDSPPDLVISGINRGPNLGTDVLYSGTVSAAIEGAILGIPSIAISLNEFRDADYAAAARFAGLLVEQFAAGRVPPFTLLNVNVPAGEWDDLAGVAITRLSHRRYKDSFIKRTDPRGRTYYWLAGELHEQPPAPDTDAGALRRNLISMTPLHLQLTDHSSFAELEKVCEALKGFFSAR